MAQQAKPRRRRRAPLSRERVLRAALALADDGGDEALSMRNLGKKLGVEAMSLYNHVANKDDIVDGLVDIVFSEIEVPSPGEVDWKTAMRRRAISTREALNRHRWAVGLMEGRMTPGPASLRNHDAVMGHLREAGFSFRAAVHRGSDDVEARSNMMMAATFAGMGFGNSGVHIPHANAYPIAGMVKDYRPAGYPQEEPMVPHGQSVSLTAPEAFRFSFDSAPVALMRDIGIPNGIGGVGYTEADVPDLVPGTMKQQRLLATCPKTPTEDDIADILTKSVQNW